MIHTPYRVWGRAGVLTEGEDEGWSRTEGPRWGVIHTPYRVWGRAGVLTERRGRWRG